MKLKQLLLKLTVMETDNICTTIKCIQLCNCSLDMQFHYKDYFKPLSAKEEQNFTSYKYCKLLQIHVAKMSHECKHKPVAQKEMQGVQ